MAIEFRCEPITVEVLDTSGKSQEHRLERRFDPLTSRSSLICPTVREKLTTFYSNRDDQCLNEISEKSKSNCPFCAPTIDKVVPKFPKD